MSATVETTAAVATMPSKPDSRTSGTKDAPSQTSPTRSSKASKLALLRTDRTSIHSTTSSRARRKMRNASIDHELHDDTLPQTFQHLPGDSILPDEAIRRSFNRAGEDGGQHGAVEIYDASSCSDSLEDSYFDMDSDEDSFCAASDDCEPDREFMESILIDEHPERLNLFDYAKKRVDPESDTEGVVDDDDLSSHGSVSTNPRRNRRPKPAPPSPLTPPRRPPNRVLTRSSEKLKSLTIEPLSPQATFETTAETVTTTTPAGSPVFRAEGAVNDDMLAATKISSHNTTTTAESDAEDDSEGMETADDITSPCVDRSDPASVRTTECKSAKTSLRTLGGTLFSRSLRGLGRSFRNSKTAAKAVAEVAVDT